jgi:hypothetical protein
MKSYVKQDLIVGSKVQGAKKKRQEAIMMSNIDNNWQFTRKMISEGKHRIFIKNY